MEPGFGRMLYSREVIDDRVKQLAAHVTGVYRGQPLMVAVVLRGAFIFAADLVRHLEEQVDISFVRVRSYGDSTSPQHEPVVRLPDDVEWRGLHVLIVEDIVDTGRSLVALRNALRDEGVASVRSCSFLDKPARREVDCDVDFVGFTLEGSEFVVGYGLDVAGRYRNLPYVATLRPDDPTD